MEGCRQMKRGRKLRIQADAMQWLLLFSFFFLNGFVYVCFDKTTHDGELFTVFIFRPQFEFNVSEVETLLTNWSKTCKYPAVTSPADQMSISRVSIILLLMNKILHMGCFFLFFSLS